MDPDACLAEIRKLKMRFLSQDEEGEPRDPDDMLRFIELIEALDGWMTGGGFPPKAWNKGNG